MRYRFRQWPVYQEARQFRKDLMREVASNFPQPERFELTSQMRRAMTSVRKTDKDLSHFINLSLSSLCEVVVCMEIAYDDQYIDKVLLEQYISRADNLIGQLIGFQKHLRNGD